MYNLHIVPASQCEVPSDSERESSSRRMRFGASIPAVPVLFRILTPGQCFSTALLVAPASRDDQVL